MEALVQHQEVIQSLLEMQQHFFADQGSMSFWLLCEELVQPLEGGWWRPNRYYNSMRSFDFMVKCNIAERLNTIRVRKWQLDIKCLVGRICSIQSSKLGSYFDTIHCKLVAYEREFNHLKDAAFLLELALWKAKVDESINDTAGVKMQCLINCGAEIIIPNVLQFLICTIDNKDDDEDYGSDSSESDGDTGSEDGGESSGTEEDNVSDEGESE